MRILVAPIWGRYSSPGWSQRLARSAPDTNLKAIREHDISESTPPEITVTVHLISGRAT